MPTVGRKSNDHGGKCWREERLSIGWQMAGRENRIKKIYPKIIFESRSNLSRAVAAAAARTCGNRALPRGYMALEYAMRGYLTDKVDVYSYGVVILKIVSGKNNTNYRPKEEFIYLMDWAYVLQEQGNLLELMDPDLGLNYSEDEALRLLNLALLCTNLSPTLRPTMSLVVSMIEGKSPVHAPIVKRTRVREDLRFKALGLLSDSQKDVSATSQQSQVQSCISMDGPLIDSSISNRGKVELQVSSSSTPLPHPHPVDVNLD
ncbi:hypothetical protein Ancab_004112 [Ancistrocladus abbreviatus]